MAPAEFDIIDISDVAFKAVQYGLTAEAVNRHMHVQTPDGKILKGVDAFAHIWSRIPKFHWASRWIKVNPIYFCARIGYEIFVQIRPWLPKKREIL